MKRIARLWISAAAALLGGACDRSTSPVCETPAGERISMAELKSLCRGQSTILTHDLVVTGSVTANDEQGELYKMLILQDDTGGIEIRLDSRRLYARYPVGMQVEVSCLGLALGDYGGKVILGAAPAGGYVVDRIPESDFPRYLRPTGWQWRTPAPHRRFADLSLRLADTYLRLEGVAFAAEEQGEPLCRPDTTARATERHLIDAAGDTLALRIRPECLYATEPVPSGTGSVIGILDYFGGRCSLRPVNHGIENFATGAAPPTADPSAAEY